MQLKYSMIVNKGKNKMVEEIKKIEMGKLLEELKKMENLIKAKEQLEREIQDKKEEEKRLSLRKKPSFFSKIFRTKRFKMYLLGEKSILTIKEDIKELKEKKKEHEEKLNYYYSKKEYYEDRKILIESIKSILDLRRLGYSLHDIIKILKESGIPIVFTDEEKKEMFEERKKVLESDWYNIEGNGIISNEKFKSLSDFIMVHKTNYPPKDGKIHSRVSGGVLHNCEITLGGEKYKFTCKSGRDTVHLSTNHEVSVNNSGDWSKMKYAVLIPFEDLNSTSYILSARAVDTYTKGPVTLTDSSYILCPKGERQSIQENNPNVTVIEYEGEYVQDYANMLIMCLGYKLELGHDYGFYDAEQENTHHDLMSNAGFKMDRHSWSEEKEEETVLGELHQIVGIIKLINEKKLLNKIGKEYLIEDLIENGFSDMLYEVLNNEKYCKILIKELNQVGIVININSLKEELLNGEENNPRQLKKNYINYIFDNMKLKKMEEEMK